MTALNYNATAIINGTEIIEVTKKEGNKRVPVGSVEVRVPTLADFGIVYPEGDLGGQWLDKCIRAATLADARNKLQSGTATLKAGAKIAQTIAELATPAENSGAALKEIGELKRAFAAFLDSLKLSPKAVSFLRGCFDSPKALMLQSPEVQAKVLSRVEEFTEVLGDDLTPTQLGYLEKLASGSDDTDLDLDDL